MSHHGFADNPFAPACTFKSRSSAISTLKRLPSNLEPSTVTAEAATSAFWSSRLSFSKLCAQRPTGASASSSSEHEQRKLPTQT